ncbi:MULTISPECIES: hypothetical protein [Streptococcus]|nr:hypothetical protein [Streptococcus ruminantium]MCK3935719.1 hypothetical protein [Streptococcus suis]
MEKTSIKIEKNVNIKANLENNKLSNEINVEDLMFGRNQPSSYKCKM